MKLNKSIQIIIGIVLLLCVISTCYSFYLLKNKEPDEIISFASGLMRLSFTIGTFLIAILLYDRFGFRKKIYEKKLDIVLDLLVLLKENIILISYLNMEKNSSSHFKIYPSKSMSKRTYNMTNQFSYIVVDSMTISQSIEPIMKLKNNPFLPKEISKSLNFFSFDELWGVENNEIYKKEHIKLLFNYPSKSKQSELEGWFRPNENTTLKSFIEKYEESFIIIEKWLNDHSNIKSELNI